MKKLQIFKLSVFYFLIFICSCEKNEYQPSETETETFTDSRDGQTYKTVQIGTQIWMAENLNYKTSFGSWATSYTTIYGRLYDWETANDVCPSGCICQVIMNGDN